MNLPLLNTETEDLIQFSDPSSSRALATTINAAPINAAGNGEELPLKQTYHAFTISPTTIYTMPSMDPPLPHATLSRISTSWSPAFSASSSRYPVPFESTNLARVTKSFHFPYDDFSIIATLISLLPSSASKGKKLQKLAPS